MYVPCSKPAYLRTNVTIGACLDQVRVQALQAAGAGRQHRGGQLRRHEALGTQRLLGPRQLVADLRVHRVFRIASALGRRHAQDGLLLQMPRKTVHMTSTAVPPCGARHMDGLRWVRARAAAAHRAVAGQVVLVDGSSPARHARGRCAQSRRGALLRQLQQRPRHLGEPRLSEAQLGRNGVCASACSAPAMPFRLPALALFLHITAMRHPCQHVRIKSDNLLLGEGPTVVVSASYVVQRTYISSRDATAWRRAHRVSKLHMVAMRHVPPLRLFSVIMR